MKDRTSDFDFQAFWTAVATQDAEKLTGFFHEEAVIEWPNTRENFALPEYIRSNCEYPDNWAGTLESMDQLAEDRFVSVVKMANCDQELSFHTISYYSIDQGKITHLREFWSEDGAAPQWRQRLLEEMRGGSE